MQAEPDQTNGAAPLQSARLPQVACRQYPGRAGGDRAQEDQARNRTKCPDEPEQAEGGDGRARPATANDSHQRHQPDEQQQAVRASGDFEWGERLARWRQQRIKQSRRLE